MPMKNFKGTLANEKTYTTTFVCHQSQKKSRSDDGDRSAAHLEEMEITTKIALTWACEGKQKTKINMEQSKLKENN